MNKTLACLIGFWMLGVNAADTNWIPTYVSNYVSLQTKTNKITSISYVNDESSVTYSNIHDIKSGEKVMALVSFELIESNKLYYVAGYIKLEIPPGPVKDFRKVN